MKTVNQILDRKNTGIITVSPNDTVQDALEIMAEKRISSFTVIEKGNVIGIISERDYIRKAVPKRVAPWDITVREIMSEKVIYVSPEDPIKECMTLMTTNHFRHLPVKSGDDLVGMLSISDVLKALKSINTDA